MTRWLDPRRNGTTSLGTSSTSPRARVNLEQILYLFSGEILTATRVIASSSRPLLSVNAVDVLLDFVRSLIAFVPWNGAGSVPEVPIPLCKVVCARHGNWFSLPEDEGGPVFIYIRISGNREGQVKCK